MDDPVGYVTEGVRLLRDHGEYRQTWLLQTHSAADMLVRGLGDHTHLDTILAAHNATCALVATLGYPDDTGVVPKSEAALLALGRRAKTTGSHTMYAAEIAAMNEMISLHDEFLDCVTVQQMEDALAFAKKEVGAGRCGMINGV